MSFFRFTKMARIVLQLVLLSMFLFSCSSIPIKHTGKKNVYVDDDNQMYSRYIHILKIFKESKTFDFEYDFYARPSSESILRIVGNYEINENEMTWYPEYLYAYVYNPGKGATKYKIEYKNASNIPEENKKLVFRIEEFNDNAVILKWINEKKTKIGIYDKAIRSVSATRIKKRE